jgi:hypothetical protein
MKAISFVALVLALTGCTVAEIQATDPHDLRPAAPGSISGPFAQAGATFHVKLDGPIGTQLSKPGDTFTATITEPIVDEGGSVIVPAGAKLHGRIADVSRGVAPKLRLSFSRVDTIDGAGIPIDARIMKTQRVTYAGEPLYASYPADPSAVGDPWMTYDSVLSYEASAEPLYSREIEIPMGSDMILQLTRPLLAPGSAYLEK